MCIQTHRNIIILMQVSFKAAQGSYLVRDKNADNFCYLIVTFLWWQYGNNI